MAARAIVAERRSIAFARIRTAAERLSKALDLSAPALSEVVKGDPVYQEMVRSEQVADFLTSIADSLSPKAEAPAEPTAPPPANPVAEMLGGPTRTVEIVNEPSPRRQSHPSGPRAPRGGKP